MATVTVKRYNGSSWDVVYPKTTIAQVINLSTNLANMQDDIDNHSHSWSEIQSKPTIPTIPTNIIRQVSFSEGVLVIGVE